MNPSTRNIIALCICATTSLATAKSHPQSSATYHLSKKIPLGGEGGWDILSVDAPNRKAYISHASHVVVVDLNTNTIVGDIANTEGVHAIGFADEFGHGFTTNGKTNSVLMFDLKTLDTIKRISVGTKPDAIAYDATAKKVLVMNAGSEDVSVLDPETGEVQHTIKLGGAPEYAVADGKGFFYVNLEESSEVLQVSEKTWKVVRRTKLTPGEGPTGIALDKKTNRLFIGCANSLMMVVDAKSGKIVSKLPVGKGIDATEFDPKTKLAMTSNGEGTISIYKELTANKFKLVQTLPTQRGARTMTFDPVTDDIITVSADFGLAPVATKENPRPRPAILPNTFTLLRFSMKE